MERLTEVTPKPWCPRKGQRIIEIRIGPPSLLLQEQKTLLPEIREGLIWQSIPVSIGN